MAGLLPKRVVVTGLGVVSPLGSTVESNWESLLEKKSGLRILTPDDMPYQEKVKVKTGGAVQGFEREKWMKIVPTLKTGYHVHSASTANMALQDANWDPKSEEEITQTGVMFGSHRTSSIDSLYAQKAVVEHGYERLERLVLPKVIVSMCIGTISIPKKICGFSNSFCAGNCTGVNAIGDSYRALGVGDSKVIIAGAAEHDLDPAVFESLIKGNYGYNTEADSNPSESVNPFDNGRKGWVLSTGGGAVLLEDLDHAKQRGAPIYAEIAGYSMLSEAGTETAKQGRGLERSMKRALHQAQLNPSDVDAVFADASGHLEFDEGEANAILKVFGEKGPSVTALKGGLGHMQGSSSSVNVALAAHSLKAGVLPPITNLKDPLKPQGKSLDYLTEAREKKLKAVVCNSINFDGTGYASLVLKAFEG